MRSRWDLPGRRGGAAGPSALFCFPPGPPFPRTHSSRHPGGRPRSVSQILERMTLKLTSAEVRMSTRGTFTGRFWAAMALFVTLAIGLAAPWAQAQEHSKLDVRTRIALAHRRGLSASIEAAREAGAAVNENGDLDVFIRGDVTRAQLEALGVTVRTELPGLFTAYVPPDVVDQVAGLRSVKSFPGAM